MDASYINGLVALAGGGQTNATLLTRTFNRITTVVTAGDSCQLPAASPGLTISAYNATANSANLFPGLGDAINSLGANAALALPANKGVQLTCMASGFWNSILSA